MENDPFILQIKNVSKSYPGVKALDAVSFDVAPGEVHALVGQNGAGKSTLIEIIAGSLRPDSGEIIYQGKSYSHLEPWESILLGIQTVHQEVQLVEDLTVAENIYLFDLPSKWGNIVDYDGCRRMSWELMKKLGINIPPEKKVCDLSFVDKKLVSIVKAFTRPVSLLIFDEPTASLDECGKNILFEIIRSHKAKGLSVIYISHHLGEIFEICDRVTILKDGKKVATHQVCDINIDDIIREMIGSNRVVLYQREKKFTRENHGEVLEIRDYSRRGVVHKVSFKVRKGEIFGLAGLVGSGRTELVRMIFGLDPKDSGQLWYKGRDITPSSPYDAIQKGLGYLTEDRKVDGLLLSRPVGENISLASLAKDKRLLIDLKKEYTEALSLVRRLDVRTPSLSQLTIHLSGGNQQKVVLAKWLLTAAEILVFDEPTVGVDVGAKVEIYQMIEGLACQGKTVILISSDNPELVALCDRVGVMRNGSLVAILEGDNLTEENILRYSMGVCNGMEVQA
ncbi:MAG: sugar ABC transporter ATP-binding protein [Candidatus Caldatribacteriaceae bacterium]